MFHCISGFVLVVVVVVVLNWGDTRFLCREEMRSCLRIPPGLRADTQSHGNKPILGGLSAAPLEATNEKAPRELCRHSLRTTGLFSVNGASTGWKDLRWSKRPKLSAIYSNIATTRARRPEGWWRTTGNLKCRSGFRQGVSRAGIQR